MVSNSSIYLRVIRLNDSTTQYPPHRPKYYKEGFKKGGKDGLGLYRAVLISGGPGIGKTTSAHLAAAVKGYNPIELNASDTRSKKLIEVGETQKMKLLPGLMFHAVRMLRT